MAANSGVSTCASTANSGPELGDGLYRDLGGNVRPTPTNLFVTPNPTDEDVRSHLVFLLQQYYNQDAPFGEAFFSLTRSAKSELSNFVSSIEKNPRFGDDHPYANTKVLGSARAWISLYDSALNTPRLQAQIQHGLQRSNDAKMLNARHVDAATTSGNLVHIGFGFQRDLRAAQLAGISFSIENNMVRTEVPIPQWAIAEADKQLNQQMQQQQQHHYQQHQQHQQNHAPFYQQGQQQQCSAEQQQQCAAPTGTSGMQLGSTLNQLPVRTVGGASVTISYLLTASILFFIFFLFNNNNDKRRQIVSEIASRKSRGAKKNAHRHPSNNKKTGARENRHRTKGGSVASSPKSAKRKSKKKSNTYMDGKVGEQVAVDAGTPGRGEPQDAKVMQLDIGKSATNIFDDDKTRDRSKSSERSENDSNSVEEVETPVALSEGKGNGEEEGGEGEEDDGDDILHDDAVSDITDHLSPLAGMAIKIRKLYPSLDAASAGAPSLVAEEEATADKSQNNRIANDHHQTATVEDSLGSALLQICELQKQLLEAKDEVSRLHDANAHANKEQNRLKSVLQRCEKDANVEKVKFAKEQAKLLREKEKNAKAQLQKSEKKAARLQKENSAFQRKLQSALEDNKRLISKLEVAKTEEETLKARKERYFGSAPPGKGGTNSDGGQGEDIGTAGTNAMPSLFSPTPIVPPGFLSPLDGHVHLDERQQQEQPESSDGLAPDILASVIKSLESPTEGKEKDEKDNRDPILSSLGLWS